MCDLGSTANRWTDGWITSLYLDGNLLSNELTDLTTAEIQQLENIGTTTISAAQWGYIGAADQATATMDDVEINSVTVSDTVYGLPFELAHFCAIGNGTTYAQGNMNFINELLAAHNLLSLPL